MAAAFVQLRDSSARGAWCAPGVLQGGDVGGDVLIELVLSPPH